MIEIQATGDTTLHTKWKYCDGDISWILKTMIY